MKTRTIVGLFFMVAILFGCKKTDTYTLIMKEAGNLKIVVLNGVTPMDDVIVTLNSTLDELVTDANGTVDFGELNSGTYTIALVNVTISGREYNVSRQVQVVAAVSKEYSINILDYVGNIDLTIFNGGVEEAGLNVAIVTRDDYWDWDGNDLNDLLALQVTSAVTDVNGQVSFELPSSITYSIIVYSSVAIYEVDGTTINLNKGEEDSDNINVNI